MLKVSFSVHFIGANHENGVTKLIAKLEGVPLEHKHSIRLSDLSFDGVTWRRLARVKVHSLEIHGHRTGGSHEFLKALAMNPEGGPKNLYYGALKKDNQCWDCNLIRILRSSNVLKDLLIIFRQHGAHLHTTSLMERRRMASYSQSIGHEPITRALGHFQNARNVGSQAASLHVPSVHRIHGGGN